MLRNPTHPARAAGFLGVLSAAICATAGAQTAVQPFNIPPGQASKTLLEWSTQTDVAVLFDFPTAKPLQTRGVSGWYRPLEALGAMLRDTALTYEVINSQTLAVIRAYCRPWLDPTSAPLPPCVQLPPEAVSL